MISRQRTHGIRRSRKTENFLMFLILIAMRFSRAVFWKTRNKLTPTPFSSTVMWLFYTDFLFHQVEIYSFLGLYASICLLVAPLTPIANSKKAPTMVHQNTNGRTLFSFATTSEWFVDYFSNLQFKVGHEISLQTNINAVP